MKSGEKSADHTPAAGSNREQLHPSSNGSAAGGPIGSASTGIYNMPSPQQSRGGRPVARGIYFFFGGRQAGTHQSTQFVISDF